ncbi:Cellulose synthase (UDP-forming) [Stanieria sp. NIES-3757]|nr:Cellulose synthase (UDP-forming) [Stanieria sp. NIES-3757]
MQTVKPVSSSREDFPLFVTRNSGFRLHQATLVILVMIGFFAAISLSWLFGNSHVTELFASLQIVQENPPSWLIPPELGNKYYLLVPTLVLFFLAQGIMRVSPTPQTWSRRIVVSILLILLVRYLLWRVLSTLNLADPVNGTFSLLLLVMELLTISGAIIQLLLMFSIKNRHREANRYSEAVEQGSYAPSVDILIPTYNEPDFILKRTIVGCQALDYPHKQIYLLDDTKRSQIKQLAQELGCHYITRPDNSHAKAGNLNHALAQTHSELVVVFDADFIPTANFLKRTVGFFQNQKIGLVQTPQSFYNCDPIARNLGLEDVLNPEEEVFYRQVEPIKDGVGSVVCAGTSFIVRRSALEEIGYFVTDSVSEDYFTGIRLAAKGYELVYLDEKLSAGLAAENISAHIDQRLRWARGTLQAFFIESNPLTIPGLTFWQRLGHLEGLLHWFTPIPRLFFLFIPIIYIFFGINPIQFSVRELVYIFLPYYIIQLSVFAWLNHRSRSAILADLYSLVQCFPVSIAIVKIILSPFARGFKVTPKGLASDRFYFNWTLALPLVGLLIITGISFVLAVLNFSSQSTFNLGLWWSIYNLVTLSVALLTLLDIPKPSFYEWFALNKPVAINFDQKDFYYGITNKLSEEGAEIVLETNAELPTKINLKLIEEDLQFNGYITHSYVQNTTTRIRIKFKNLSLNQQKSLIKMLYCRPGQWRRKNSPGEIKSLLIMLKVLLRPLTLLRHKRAIAYYQNKFI